MKVVDRKDITDPLFREILDRESHHDHIIVDDDGTLRWKANNVVLYALQEISLNALTILLYELGCDKNSELYRKLYRDMGYSLSGYWEIFYWDMNNEECDAYVGGK